MLEAKLENADKCTYVPDACTITSLLFDFININNDLPLALL